MIAGLWLAGLILGASSPVAHLEAFGTWAALVHGSGDLEVVDTLGRTLWWQRIPDLVQVEGGPLLLYVLRSDRLETYGSDGIRVGEVPVKARALAVTASGEVYLLDPEGIRVYRLNGTRLEPALSLPVPALGLEGAGLGIAVRFPDSVWVVGPQGERWWGGSQRVQRVFAQGMRLFWVQRGDTLFFPRGIQLPGVKTFDLAPGPDLWLWWLDQRGLLRALRIARGFPEP